MRSLSLALFGLALLAAIAGVVMNLYANGMACAFVTGTTAGQGCAWRLPWQMRGEDLLILVVLPFGLAAALAVAGILVRRGSTRR